MNTVDPNLLSREAAEAWTQNPGWTRGEAALILNGYAPDSPMLSDLSGDECESVLKTFNAVGESGPADGASPGAFGAWFIRWKRGDTAVQKLSTPAEKPLDTRSRDSHLLLIKALTTLAGIDINRAHKAAQVLAAEVARLGVSISDNTIVDILRNIPLAIERRSK